MVTAKQGRQEAWGVDILASLVAESSLVGESSLIAETSLIAKTPLVGETPFVPEASFVSEASFWKHIFHGVKIVQSEAAVTEVKVFRQKELHRCYDDGNGEKRAAV